MYKDEILPNCFRYLGMHTFAEVERLTIPEYNLNMKVLGLRWVDIRYFVELGAFESFRAQGKKKAGKNKQKPAYPTFKKFFDYEKELAEAGGNTKNKDRFLELSRHLKGVD